MDLGRFLSISIKIALGFMKIAALGGDFHESQRDFDRNRQKSILMEIQAYSRDFNGNSSLKYKHISTITKTLTLLLLVVYLTISKIRPRRGFAGPGPYYGSGRY